MKYDFLIEAYESERVKVLSVWSEFKDEDLPVRPLQGDPRGRSVHEQMVHQCVSEDCPTDRHVVEVLKGVVEVLKEYAARANG